MSLPLFNNDNILVTTTADGSQPVVRKTADNALSPTVENLKSDQNGVLTQNNDGNVYLDPNGSLEVDIEGESTTINSLRRAFRLQEWLERDARGGTRYIENIFAHFGVKSSDARLQRPEYVGGGYQNMVISEVLSTAQTDPSGSQEVPVGYLAGHGISAGGSKRFKYRAEEHGWLIGILNVQPVTAYFQGLPRMYSRQDRLDYYWPAFANIGEQEVYNKEIKYDTAAAPDGDNVFGYIPRYAEYKYIPNRVAGEMQDTLKFWHLARDFSATPVLNESFIECNPSDRIFAVQNAEHIYAHVYNNVKAVRKMPVFGTPTI